MDKWTAIRNGKEVIFTYEEIGKQSARMTARAEGDEFTQLLDKTGLKLPLSHKDVEDQFASLFPKG